MKIVTEYDPASFKPRSHWWMATDADGCGCGECFYPVGYGETEAAALDDLNTQVADRREYAAEARRDRAAGY